MHAHKLFLQYLTVTSAVGLVGGIVHGATLTIVIRKKSMLEAFPEILTQSVCGMIVAQYLPVAIPYYLYKKTGCTLVTTAHWK
jgi:hypothetical protein